MLLSRIIYRSVMRSAVVLVLTIFLLINLMIMVGANATLDTARDNQHRYLSTLTLEQLKTAIPLSDDINGWRLIDDYGNVLAQRQFEPSWQVNTFEMTTPYGVLFISQQSLFSAVLGNVLVTNALLLFLVIMNLTFAYKSVLKPWRTFMHLEAWANRYSKKGDSRFFVRSTDYTLVNTIRSLYQLKQDAQNGGNKVEHLIRSQTFLDKVTGLGNRVYFEHRLEALLQQEDEAYGAVLIVQFGALDDLDGPNHSEALVELLGQYADILKDYVDDTRQSLVSRISKADFAILLPFVDIKEVEKTALNILRLSQKIETPNRYDKNAICHIGADLFTVADSSFQILAEADMALRAAQLHGPSGWFVYETDSLPQSDIKGSVRWRTAIENALAKNKFKLYFQPVAEHDKCVHHFEVFVRMEDDKRELVNAKVFLPMARKSGLIPEVDKQVLTLLAKTLNKNREHTISVNIHIDSWLNRDFANWLISFVRRNRNIVDHIIFEISEFEVAQHVKGLRSLFSALKRYHARTMVDQVGLYVLDTSYLNFIQVDYIKLHQSIVNNIHQRPENQMFVRSLTAITNQKMVTMFAVGVETTEEARVLRGLGINALQGHYVSEPLLKLPKTSQMLRFAGDR